MNSFTTGICMIGNYMDTIPTDTALQQLKKLIAWEACDKNIPPGDTALHTASSLFLPRIAAHRDANTATTGCPKGTVCPGDSLYALLPQIRNEIASYSCLQGVYLPEISTLQKLSVYPNPGFGNFTIRIPDKFRGLSELRLISPQGNLIWETKLKIYEEYYVPEFPKDKMTEGMYIVQLNNQHYSSRTKLIFQID